MSLRFTRIQESMVNEAEYDLSQSVCEAIAQLTM